MKWAFRSSPLIWNVNDATIEPSAAQSQMSDGNFAVCCSMLRAIGPSRCSSRGLVLGSVLASSFNRMYVSLRKALRLLEEN